MALSDRGGERVVATITPPPLKLKDKGGHATPLVCSAQQRPSRCVATVKKRRDKHELDAVLFSRIPDGIHRTPGDSTG